jgi:hypothetical protein
MHRCIWRVLSSPYTTAPPLRAAHPPRAVSSSHPRPIRISTGVMKKLRTDWVSAVAKIHISDKAELARAVRLSMRDFLLVAASNKKSELSAMDAIGLIKLCRKSSQPFHIADIWPQIQRLSLLVPDDERKCRTLIGSVLTATLEAKNASLAASVWAFLRSSPHLPLEEAHVSQLLSALRGRPDLVVEAVTALQQGSLGGVRANAQHFAVALQAVVGAPEEAKRVYELAFKHNMVPGILVLFEYPHSVGLCDSKISFFFCFFLLFRWMR